MKLSEEQVKHLADLIKLNLTEERIREYQDQLSSILNYVEMLNEVDTSTIDAIAQMSEIEVDDLREDEVACDEKIVKELINSAPEHKDNYIKTAKIF